MKYAVIIILIIPLIVIAQSGRVKVTGEYTYTYGDNESLLEAKSLCYTMAIRNAIESLTVFVQSTATVDNYQLKNDLVQTIASGYIDDLRVDEEDVVGRTVYYAITGYVVPSAVKNIIQNRIGSAKNKLAAIDNNGYLEILKTRVSDSKVNVTFKVLQNTGELQYYGDRNEKPQFKVLIDFYDQDGEIIDGNGKFIHENFDEMVEGQIGTVNFDIPNNSKSYRVWLLK